LTGEIRVIPLRAIPELEEGDELAAFLVAAAVRAGGFESDDVVVVAQKAVSKVEGRVVDLSEVVPSPRARELAADEDPRRLEVILRETREIVRARPPLVIAETQHGFVSLLELADGGLGMVWLDGRDQELNTTDPLGGSMALYFASFDSSWKQTAENVVNARVCECCQTAAVVTADGVLTAFRDRSADEIRDIKVSRLDAGKWTPELALHDDNWKIDACPINGPALSSRGRQVAAAWFAAPNDNGRAFVAFSQDAGKTWSPAIRLDDEASLGRVDIEMLDDGSAIASWVEFANGKSQFKVRHLTSSGQRSAAVDVPGAGRVSGYPRMTRAGNELILAWTDGEGGNQVKAAVARLK
jgi:hypothetical protein